ncbi:unnamed protein product [Macrosiphum euphorbiae]|uniref:Uncharacterized protein n=1 Tax=Macrosiphum euphorbiae TaxID=13131 RepID=A0AAV0W3H5_9HEMI|nr:unnamed protein product [Macrosiphum euphorbiae]
MISFFYEVKSFVYEHRWLLSFAVVASVLGYLAGMHFCGSLMPYSGTGLSTSTGSPPSSVQYWGEVQKKIDQMADDVRQLQSYVNTGRRIFRLPKPA